MKPKLRKYLIHTLLFLLGVVVGGMLFAPWQQLWSGALTTLSERMPVPLTWKRVGDSSMTSVTVHGLVLAAPKGMVRIDELRVSLGLSPLVKVSARTGGQVLDLSASMGGMLDVAGAMDVGALLPGRNMQGGLSLNGAFAFDKWTRPPSSGTLSASASTLQLPNGMRAEKMQLAADLEGRNLKLKSFTLERPVAVTGAGTVTLDYGNFMNSALNVTGTVKMGPKETKFKKTGALKSLM